MTLNEKQKTFCDFYLISNNAGEAYRQAYDPSGDKLTQGTCYTQGSRLLKKPQIQDYLNSRITEMKSDRLMTAEQILEHITTLATDPSVKPSDRLRALELLGKNKAMFTDKVDMNATVDVEVNLSGFDEEAE